MGQFRKLRVAERGRLLIVGDVRGELDLAEILLDSAGIDRETDLVVSTGDLIDHGPNSMGMVNWLAEPWFHSVRGANERVACDALAGSEVAFTRWLQEGGEWVAMLTSDEREQLKIRLAGLPDMLLIEYGSLRIGVVHAGFPDARLFESAEVDPETLLFGVPPAHCPPDLDYLVVGRRVMDMRPGVASVDQQMDSDGAIAGVDLVGHIQFKVTNATIIAEHVPDFVPNPVRGHAVHLHP